MHYLNIFKLGMAVTNFIFLLMLFFLTILITSFFIFHGRIIKKSILNFFIRFGEKIFIWVPGKNLLIFKGDLSKVPIISVFLILQKFKKVFPLAGAP